LAYERINAPDGFDECERSSQELQQERYEPEELTLRNFIRWIMGKLGLRLIRTKNIKYLCSCDALEDFFSSLRTLGFAPKHIIDVGANHGVWTRTAIKYFPDAQYTLVEPQERLRSHIQDLVDHGYKIQWINAGAGDKPGSMPLIISPFDDRSSFVLSDSHGRHANSPQVTVAVKTLNEIAATNAIPPDMVKIDAEGFDLKVLAGASNLLGKTDIFLVEAMVCGNYENSLAEVMKFMMNAGYRLIDMTTPTRHPKYNFLWLGEFAFLRNGSSLLQAVSHFD
jgi:FkbM family methyltransferase